jgi:hypothetical protein
MDPPRSLVEHMNQEIERSLLGSGGGGGGGYSGGDASGRHVSQPDSSSRPSYYNQPSADSSRSALKGQCHEMVVEVRPRSGRLGLN